MQSLVNLKGMIRFFLLTFCLFDDHQWWILPQFGLGGRLENRTDFLPLSCGVLAMSSLLIHLQYLYMLLLVHSLYDCVDFVYLRCLFFSFFISGFLWVLLMCYLLVIRVDFSHLYYCQGWCGGCEPVLAAGFPLMKVTAACERMPLHESSLLQVLEAVMTNVAMGW